MAYLYNDESDTDEITRVEENIPVSETADDICIESTNASDSDDTIVDHDTRLSNEKRIIDNIVKSDFVCEALYELRRHLIRFSYSKEEASRVKDTLMKQTNKKDLCNNFFHGLI